MPAESKNGIFHISHPPKRARTRPLAIHPDTLIVGRRICIMMPTMAIDLENARERMVLEQLERRGIKEPRVLDAMRTVPRHPFLPAQLGDHAYDDGPLPIGDSQTVSQPYMVALMSEVAELTGAEKVLEVGTGSGYPTALPA